MPRYVTDRTKPHYIRVECVRGGAHIVFGQRYWAVIRPGVSSLYETEVVMEDDPDTTRVVPSWRFKPIHPRNWRLWPHNQRLQFGPDSYAMPEAA